MLGENLTVEGLDENEIQVGDIYKVGSALVQVTQPREPCSTFGVKMGSIAILKQFIAHGRPGTYVRVIEEGFVADGDTFELIERKENSLTTAQFFNLLFSKDKDQELLAMVVSNDAIPQRKRDKLSAFLKTK